MQTSELIARLEAATGADEWCDYYLWRIAMPLHDRWTMGDIGGLEGVPLWGDPRKDRDWDKSPPAFTASIDAALTLVPKGLGFKLDRYWIASVDHAVWSATIMRGGLPDRPYKTWEVWDAPTPAIAIVIASLRARNEGEG